MKITEYEKLKGKQKKNAFYESKLLAAINHPNIITYKEVFTNKKK